MDLTYSLIRLSVPTEYYSMADISEICKRIASWDETAYPIPILTDRFVRIEFMTYDTNKAILELRAIGQQPKIVSSFNIPSSDVCRDNGCPNCGWIVTNPLCMRCM